MTDWSSASGVPWYNSRGSVTSLLLPDTLTETPKEVQLSQLGRLYRQTPLVFCWKAGNSVLESENTKQNSRQTECPTEDAK